MIPVVQARRRAWAAEIWSPVSGVHIPAAFRSASSWSRVVVTTMVAEQPPAVGREVAGMVSRSLAERESVPHRGGQVLLGVDAGVGVRVGVGVPGG